MQLVIVGFHNEMVSSGRCGDVNDETFPCTVKPTSTAEPSAKLSDKIT